MTFGQNLSHSYGLSVTTVEFRMPEAQALNEIGRDCGAKRWKCKVVSSQRILQCDGCKAMSLSLLKKGVLTLRKPGVSNRATAPRC